MCWRSVSLTACSAALLAAGCGGERLPVLTAVQLQRLAAGGDCRGLVQAAIAAVNRREVPAALQEQLLSDVQALGAKCSADAAGRLAARLAP
jgi:hypothetical protein